MTNRILIRRAALYISNDVPRRFLSEDIGGFDFNFDKTVSPDSSLEECARFLRNHDSGYQAPPIESQRAGNRTVAILICHENKRFSACKDGSVVFFGAMHPTTRRSWVCDVDECDVSFEFSL